MPATFTPESLPAAIAGLFRLNGYEVTGPIIKYGGEVDLQAIKTGDLFGDPVYIEATVEHVGNEKYAKDLTKLVAIREQEPNAKLMIVSSAGFTASVLGKAEGARITAMTFDNLERRFQHFEPYIHRVLKDSAEADDLAGLVSIYEEPDFEDALGHHQATDWLTTWLTDPESPRWLIVTGEYGTGKTALTRVLLHRWLEAYRADSTLPVPFRIELRAFTRQFDARTLLHHFLDHNGMGHVSLDFVLSLIRQGRVVLLLDGYDEMAQYMHARERRACLEALAQLSADGARGILTSRPNYFTEAEELQVLDVLYTTLEQLGELTRDEANAAADERELDALFEQHIIERVERQLRDLTPAQTEQLVERKLAGDDHARKVVTRLLRRIFRSSEEGTDIALSGKPVIITYLLEIADGLKEDDGDSDSRVTEWQVYDLVVRNLMVRDWRAAQEILFDRRRDFLGRLALLLSRRDYSLVSDESFTEFVRNDFAAELRKLPAEAREERLQQLVTDLRRSATLTRAAVGGLSGSRFSHNSLREFLASETLLRQLQAEESIPRRDLPVTPAMRNFVASQTREQIQALVNRLGSYWPRRGDDDGAGQLLSLVWDAALRLHSDEADLVRATLLGIAGPGLDLSRVSLDGLTASGLGTVNLRQASFARSTLSQVSLSGADLTKANFSEAVLDEVDLADARLVEAQFGGVVAVDLNVTDADVKGADFRGIDLGGLSVIDQGQRFDGASALGLLGSRGAITDSVDEIHVIRHHPKYEVASKVARVLLDGGKVQVLGLTQRGTAASDPRFARRFMVLLLNEGWLSASQGRQLVQMTDVGRHHLGPFAALRHLTPEMKRVFQRAL